VAVPLDPDHLRAMIREHHRGERPGREAGEFDDSKPLQRLFQARCIGRGGRTPATIGFSQAGLQLVGLGPVLARDRARIQRLATKL
jgi:hypothetical protein